MRSFLACVLFCVSALLGACSSESHSDVIQNQQQSSEDGPLTPEQTARAQTLLPVGALHGRTLSVSSGRASIGLETGGTWDFRKFDTPVKDQGQRGTCTAFSTVAVVEHLYKEAKGAIVSLSEDDLWSFYQQYDHHASTEAAAANFISWESDWPYDPSYFRNRVFKPAGHVHAAQWTTLDQGLDQIVQTLKTGLPVVFALDVSQAFMRTKSDGVISDRYSGVVGGHAIEAVGVVEGPQFGGGGAVILKNSWSTSWGDKGYAYLPYSYCARFSCYEAIAPVKASLEVK